MGGWHFLEQPPPVDNPAQPEPHLQRAKEATLQGRLEEDREAEVVLAQPDLAFRPSHGGHRPHLSVAECSCFL